VFRGIRGGRGRDIKQKNKQTKWQTNQKPQQQKTSQARKGNFNSHWWGGGWVRSRRVGFVRTKRGFQRTKIKNWFLDFRFFPLFWIFDVFLLNTDNVTARESWIRRWRDQKRVIPLHRKFIFWQELHAGQLGLSHNIKSQRARDRPRLFPQGQRQIHGSLVVKLSLYKCKNRKSKKFLLTWTLWLASEALPWTFAKRILRKKDTSFLWGGDGGKPRLYQCLVTKIAGGGRNDRMLEVT